MGRKKSDFSRKKYIRIRLSNEEFSKFNEIMKYHPTKTKSDLVRIWINDEYNKHNFEEF